MREKPMFDGPDPTDPVYIAAAAHLLTEMRRVCEEAREFHDELEESWPKELKIHPASKDACEGVLYMPRAGDPVVLFQACAHINPITKEVSAHSQMFVPLSMETIGLGMDYLKRAEHYVNTCVCGHVIPQFSTFPVRVESELDGELDAEDLEELRAAEEAQLAEIQGDLESDYACPACGYKPHRRYD